MSVDYTLPKFKSILLLSFCIIFFAVLSYYFVDRIVAEWTYYNSRFSDYHMVYDYITHLEPLYYNLSPWFVLYLVYRLAANKEIKLWHRVVFLMIMSMWLTELFNNQLRVIFSRYWPVSWFHGNMSWINHKAYGFNWLKSGHEYHSFPSGHTALIFGFMTSLWWQCNDNRLIRIFVLINCISVPCSLILMCYHFTADVLIGALVGILSAYCILYGYQKLVKS